MSNLNHVMWVSPVHETTKLTNQLKQQMETSISYMTLENEASSSSCDSQTKSVNIVDSTSVLDVSFDTDKMLNCCIENGNTLIHGAGGRGYGLAGVPVSSGSYQWKVCQQT